MSDFDGYLVSIDGSDLGSRPAALQMVRDVLDAQGREVIVSRWMASSLAGGVYRQAAQFAECSPRTLALLASCDLAERMEWEILPALRDGKIVLADRYLYRVALGLARDVDPEWLEVLCGAGPVPDLALHFPMNLAEAASVVDPTRLDLYEAGMDLGLTRDLPLSYRFYQERLVAAYGDWSRRHELAIHDCQTAEDALGQIDRLLGAAPAANQRRLSALRLLERSGADADNARQVARLAKVLFKMTQEFHQLLPAARDVLEVAALLHDLAGTVGMPHPMRSARRIKESQLEGFQQVELDQMAVLVAIHRAMEEETEAEGWFGELSVADQQTVRMLGPLLRLAIGLDASRSQTVRWIDATIHDGLFDLLLRAKSKAKLEVKAAVQRADLFEQAYGLHLAIDVDRKGPPPSGPRLEAAAAP
ncbi:MAG: HD domain-containing protein [Chloroflexi bacterium]|nr:HD domain-containing protein [Chloroflexota bacterium]